MMHAPAYNIHIRTGRVEGSIMEAWPYGMVERRCGTDWELIPEFSRYSDDGTFTSFIVELIYNTVEANFVSTLCCRDGRTPFCQRSQAGGEDTIGIALRRWLTKSGIIIYKKIECDPSQCDLRLLHKTSGKSEASRRLPAEYKEIYKGNLQVLREDRPPSCKPQCAFLFRLLLPDGSDYAHGPYEVAALTTTSDKTRGLIYGKLCELWSQTGGNLSGLRLELRAQDWEGGRHDKTFTAWELNPLSEESVTKQLIDQSRRLALRNLDRVKVGAQIETALALIEEGNETGLAQFMVSDDIRAAVDIKKLEMEREAFEATYIDPSTVDLPTNNIFVQQIADRLDLSYAARTALVLQYGPDHFLVMRALIQQAKAQNIPFRDIWLAYGKSIGEDFNVAAKPAAPKAPPATTEPVDADFQEPVPCPRCGADAFPGKDGAVDCPKCGDGQRGIADDMAAVRGEQQTLL